MSRRREALAWGLALGFLYSLFGPLWLAYGLGVGAILAACWKQSGELTAAQHKRDAYKERAKWGRP